MAISSTSSTYVLYASEHMNAITCLGLALATAAFWLSWRSADPYGLFHLSLNSLPSDDSNIPPPTEWLNMGFWPGAKSFPEACKALALKNILAAQLKPESHILDVGYGTGESLLLLLSDSGIPRPSLLAGITSLRAHYERSKKRVEDLKNRSAEAAQTRVVLFHDDAVWSTKSSKHHPLRPLSIESPSSSTTFDAILVLDCAYHFNTRRRFIEQAFEHLKAGGRISLADICFSSSALQKSTSKWLIRLFKLMPSSNIISIEEYEQQMKEMGYMDVIVEDITQDVFPGFTSFLKSRGAGWWIFSQILTWYAYAGARFVIASGSRPEK
ncbi:hypothetical protein CVT24_011594 [Panaeolus cyanescens]|uniref:phosphoethanolamine N-methyltransferase n=1 Tax=Panaeolus cyanescens TaxID=181874 RepID=A0A409YV55_9AGAR|nr:hypothetical protein CVT24_011594 [Panaeolus cyanescens]